MSFIPEEHLAFVAPAKVHTMQDIGLSSDTGVSDTAVSEPFPLFSTKAVEMMRKEALSEDVWQHCQYKSNLAACQLRGFCPKFGPFTHAAWTSSETLAIISGIAGVDLVPSMDFEIGHVNISVKSEEEVREELRVLSNPEEGAAKVGKPIVDWHTDSYPFVCVLMLSDASKMVGGETALKKPSGEIVKVRGPQMGSAVVLQGRYIEHQALKALGTSERMTMVTSFRPRSPFVRDDTVLATVRGISDLPELYSQFSEYRLEILSKRIGQELDKLRCRRHESKALDVKGLKAFLRDQQEFLKRTDEEMVNEEDVQKGQIDDAIGGIRLPENTLG
ncbi:MAG: hypothetical protein M1825_000292 [Sarcosagium campestre]|nr:MAG: hypothetical protein M1825_000292 [Sarcosagium campestre]